MSSLDRRAFLARSAVLALGLASGGRLLGASVLVGTYRVRRGDTLTSIAHSHGVTVGDLKRANGLKTDLILAGQTLTLPGAAPRALAPVIAATRGLRISRRRWQMIVGHHSAIAQGNAKIYDRAHRERGMEHGLAYHFVIGNGIDSGDGEIEVGGRWTGQIDGGHVRNDHVNHIGIGICCVGNFEVTRPTANQIASFNALVSYLRDDVMGGQAILKVHREIQGAQTLCPGRHFPITSIRRKFAA